MAAIREAAETGINSADAVKISYDLQSGSYVDAWNTPSYRKLHDPYCAEMASFISDFRPSSLLEAGVGEATTLCSIVSNLHIKPGAIVGFDLSWSRIHVARQHAAHRGLRDPVFCAGALEQIPFPDNSFDLVYTAHAVEPNHGKEQAIIGELLRVTRDKLILFEPSYELGNADTRARIETHGYCRDLPSAALSAGGRIVMHQLLKDAMRRENNTAALVIEKVHASPVAAFDKVRFACPQCRTTLVETKGNHYCTRCALVYPSIEEIPCLLLENGILASRYADVS